MGGKVLEYEAKTIRNEGLKEGVEKGIEGTVSILKSLNPSLPFIIKMISYFPDKFIRFLLD